MMFRILCVFGLVGVAVATSHAQDTSPQRGLAPVNGPQHRANIDIHYASRQALGKGVTLAKLSSGLTVIVQENHAAPVATVRSYVVNTGSAFEGKDMGAGLSHMLEHLVAGGTTTIRPEKEVRALVDSMGGRTNAYTSNDITAFYIDCPADKTALALELIAQNMQFSTIPEDEYLREMGVVQRELEKGEQERRRVSYNRMKQLIYQVHPMRHPTIGYLPVVQQVKRQDVIDFYHNRYVPQNMIIIVVGDVNTDDVLDEVLKDFKDFHRTTERAPILPVEPDQASPRTIRVEMEGPTAQISLAWPTVPLQDPNLYPLDVAAFVLTHGDSSRLAKRLKIDQPLATSVSSSSFTPGFVKGWFQITAECAPENLDEVRRIILEEVDKLKTTEVSEAELAKVKRQKAAEHVFGQQTVQNQAEMLASSYRSTGDPLFDDQYVAGIQTVTAEQIRNVARKYFLPQRMNTVIIEPLGSGAKRQATSDSSPAESEIIRKQFPNGLTVLLKRHSVVPLVSIQAFVKGGATSDTNADSGLASLACQLMTRGTKKYTGEQIDEYFDSIGGSLSVSSQRNSSYLQSSVLASDFDASMDYVHQVLVEPTFPEEEFERVKGLHLRRIAARAANPQTEILDFWASEIPDSSPYHRTVSGTVETVSKLTVEDCRKFRADYFVPNNMVIAIFGDIDVDATLAKLETMFGSLPRSDSFHWPEFPENQPLAKSRSEHLQNQKQDTGMIMLSYPICSIYDQKSRDSLEVLSGILTGGSGAGGRLHEELRGARLVYYVFGFQINGFAPGYYNVLTQTRPESINDVIGRIEAAIEKIKNEGVPAEEFEGVKGKLIAAHAMKNTTPSGQAFQAAIDELYGLGYEHDRGYDKRIADVTVDDVVKVVQTYFQHGLVVTTSPNASPDEAAEPDEKK
ncbi:Peptidase M16 inactive domain protein [Symmachiella dynata]|uniref:M16 family metallopeptidase n=1 Tax=Symmachiella dynata TaxID=2527995 RepID=UPI00118868BA|nr:pitrilysin family protein [Symmachiella dynata]QDT50052.1 Peptidase M16 inactive domain protein [Symmachiella dynata]